jgi:tetratricopeptide (TPR) repeat protein
VYITTFYSFKGGVGRTMALVNVALSLAKEGRKVLLVDFDLEAPGLETFDVLRPPAPVDGVIDFVHSYQETGESPDVRNYVFERSDCADKGGRLWVMAAGRRDALYESRLNSINWSRLYAEQDGYLLFEDLKAQWRKALAPDYVFLDSRTGHTDIGGICTRQLPDAVVLLFFPNDQNLLGLTGVVEDIRAESQSGRRSAIELHFVTSNVPDLDDEDHILADRLRDFQDVLKYRSPAAIIHHYPSLSLLNQEVFSVRRPRSRLAGEYRKLQREIIKANHWDRLGALDFLRDRMAWRKSNIDSKVNDIANAHPGDGEILFEIGRVEEKRGRLDEAFSRFSQAEHEGWHTTALLRERLNLVTVLGGDPSVVEQQIREDARGILAQSDATFEDVAMAVGYLRNQPNIIRDELTTSTAYQALDVLDQAKLIDALLSPKQLMAAEKIIEDIFSRPGAIEKLHGMRLWGFSLGLIALSRFREAMQFLGPTRPTEMDDIPRIFNYAMAEWGETNHPPIDLLTLVSEADRRGVPRAARQSPNYQQCMAIAYWAAGDLIKANSCCVEALELSRQRRPQIVSCWRYLNVSPKEFSKDVEAIQALIRGDNRVPAFISDYQLRLGIES